MNNQSSSKASRANRTWQDGEIAFLKSSEYFLAKDHQHLIASGHLHVKATGHPVIILKAGPGRAIVTTITAFNSGPQNNFLPPWRMRAHQEKHLDDYHAFIGTQLPPKSPNAHLKLSDSGAKMNKPRASWVYIKHLYTVPYTVLLRWNKLRSLLHLMGHLRLVRILNTLGLNNDALYRINISSVCSQWRAPPLPRRNTQKGYLNTHLMAKTRHTGISPRTRVIKLFQRLGHLFIRPCCTHGAYNESHEGFGIDQGTNLGF
ncbi:hypothetical protein LA080_015162 [Diaporthe eres]|nr:hypothetical protein LA080_015162 [Diaporthe eres]